MKQEALDALKKFIEEQRKFKIEGYEEEYSCLKDFIMSFHRGKLAGAPNIFLDNGTRMRRGSYRSLVDTIIACQVHYNATVEEVLELFQEAYDKGTLVGHYCTTINRLILRLYDLAWVLSPSTKGGGIDKELPNVKFEDLFSKTNEKVPV